MGSHRVHNSPQNGRNSQKRRPGNAFMEISLTEFEKSEWNAFVIIQCGFNSPFLLTSMESHPFINSNNSLRNLKSYKFKKLKLQSTPTMKTPVGC